MRQHLRLGANVEETDRRQHLPCQARPSRKMPAPAGAPTSVDMRIQAGSSLGLGTGCMLVWVPGICLTGPFSQVWSHIKKLMQQPPETSIAWRIPRISSAPYTVTPTASAIFCRSGVSLPKSPPPSACLPRNGAPSMRGERAEGGHGSLLRTDAGTRGRRAGRDRRRLRSRSTCPRRRRCAKVSASSWADRPCSPTPDRAGAAASLNSSRRSSGAAADPTRSCLSTPSLRLRKKKAQRERLHLHLLSLPSSRRMPSADRICASTRAQPARQASSCSGVSKSRTTTNCPRRAVGRWFR